MSESVFIVLRDTYGSNSRPKGVWSTLDMAIKQALELAPDGCEYKEFGEGYDYHGSVKSGMESWQVFEYQIDTDHIPALDVTDNGPNAPTRKRLNE